MMARTGPRLAPALRSVSQAASAVVILVGCLVLVGWMLDIATLKSILPSLVTMKANAAVAFILAGVSLRLLQNEPVNLWRRNLAWGGAFATILVSLLTLSEYLFKWNLGIDQLLFQEGLEAVATSTPGRMSPNTALTFVLVGCALLLLGKETDRGTRFAQFLALVAAVVPLFALVGYATGVASLYGIAGTTKMAVHTMVTFIVLCVGILFARPDRELMTAVTGDGEGAIFARRMLLVAIGVPIMVGRLSLEGQRAGLYGTDFSQSLVIVTSIIVFVLVTWWTAIVLQSKTSELQRAQGELSAMGVMAASIAHEVRQPLAAMVTSASAGLRWLAKVPPELNEALNAFKSIVDDGDRANDVLQTIRAMFKKGSQDIGPIDVNKLAREVLSLVHLDVQRHAVLAKIEIADNLPRVFGNRTQIQQVILNLVVNAIEAMSTITDRRRELRIKCEAQLDSVLITVEDTGTGIDPKNIDRIFDALFTTKLTGMGMGLSICRSIIETHHGRLWASSANPQGSVFHIVLPTGMGPDDVR